jgi:hypothetical protein
MVISPVPHLRGRGRSHDTCVSPTTPSYSHHARSPTWRSGLGRESLGTYLWMFAFATDNQHDYGTLIQSQNS